MMNPLCDNCHEREATVFITKILNNEASKQRLCESCARDMALGEGWIQHLTGQDAEALGDIPLEDIVLNIFGQMKEAMENDDEDDEESDEEHDPFSLSELAAFHATEFPSAEFPADEDLVDEIDEEEGEEELDALEEEESPNEEIIFPSSLAPREESNTKSSHSNPFAHSHSAREIPVVRCPKCETTWDRLRQDGRVGCANCYEVFHDQLSEVMDRLQHASQHIGKMPPCRHQKAATPRTSAYPAR